MPCRRASPVPPFLSFSLDEAAPSDRARRDFRAICAFRDGKATIARACATCTRAVPMTGELDQTGILRPIVLVAAERAALEPLGNRIGLKLGLRGERLVAKLLALALRMVAVAERRLVIPPPARVVGHAEEDLVADIRVLEPDA